MKLTANTLKYMGKAIDSADVPNLVKNIVSDCQKMAQTMYEYNKALSEIRDQVDAIEKKYGRNPDEVTSEEDALYEAWRFAMNQGYATWQSAAPVDIVGFGRNLLQGFDQG